VPRKKQRKSAADLVRNSDISGPRSTSWFLKLSHTDQEYIKEVVDELIDNPFASLYIVAEQLIEELDIERASETVARTLKKMVKHGQAKREKVS
jgi:predicted transcriptional regulator